MSISKINISIITAYTITIISIPVSLVNIQVATILEGLVLIPVFIFALVIKLKFPQKRKLNYFLFPLLIYLAYQAPSIWNQNQSDYTGLSLLGDSLIFLLLCWASLAVHLYRKSQ